MSLKQKTVQSIFWSALQQFGRQGFSFVFSIILARMLLPEQFGYIAMIMVFINVCTTLIDSGLTQSLIRDENEDHRDYSTVFFFNIVAGGILYLLLYFGAPYIAGFYDEPVLHNLIRWQALLIIIHALSLIQETQLIKKLDFKSQFFASLPSIIIAGCIAIFMAYKGFGVYAITAYYVLDAAIRAVFLWIISPFKPGFRFNTEKFKYHFKFGSHLTLAGVLDTAFNELYNIILGKYFSPAHLGFFNRAYSMQKLPVSNLSNILNKVTYPIFAKIKNNNPKLKEVYGKLMLAVFFIVTPTLLFMGILAVPIFRLLLTEKWLPAVPYFKILCIAGIAYPLSSYNINLLKIKGESAVILRLQLYKKFIFALSLSAIIIWGLYGLLYGILFNSIVAFFLNSYYSGRIINFSTTEQIKSMLPLGIISFISASVLFILSKLFKHLPDSMQLVMGISVGFLLYFILVYIFERKVFHILKEVIENR
ncbi:MAG: lipopolysaccharide biosynthesis protein [Flavobacteriaceae bacterium]|nr:lipopolysaccharide biosynthesis protein [Flavobacteriaceae bacterium]